MKATKKIVGAACALVAAVALSAGSTFAWFASNSNVQAKGMKVQAQVPTNIYIDYGYIADAASVQRTEIDFSSTDASTERHASTDVLSPAVVSTSSEDKSKGVVGEGNDGGKSGKDVSAAETTNALLYLYTAPAITEDGKWSTKPGESEPGTPSELVDVAYFKAGTDSSQWSADADDYIATFNMTIANKSQAASINAKITVNTTGVDLEGTLKDGTLKFVRTGLLVGMQAEAGGAMTYKFYSIANDADSGTALTANGTVIDYETILPNMPQNTVATISFFAWFDGQDEDCTVNNAASLGEISFIIDFTTPSSLVPGGPGA